MFIKAKKIVYDVNVDEDRFVDCYVNSDRIDTLELVLYDEDNRCEYYVFSLDGGRYGISEEELAKLTK